MSFVFPRLSRSSILGSLAFTGVAFGVYTKVMRPVKLDDGAPPKVFGGGPAFVSLPLESAEMVNHNTKKLRFKLPTPDSVSGLPLGCESISMGMSTDRR
jgi:cytochrome-b5 reductase